MHYNNLDIFIMKKILLILFLFSTIFCNAKEYYFEGIYCENGVKGCVREFITGDVTRIYFSWFKDKKTKTTDDIYYLSATSPIIIVKEKNRDKIRPEKNLQTIIDNYVENGIMQPISEINDGLVNNISCKYVDFKKKNIYQRCYCFIVKDQLFTIICTGTKKLDKLIEQYKIVNTFEYHPE